MVLLPTLAVHRTTKNHALTENHRKNTSKIKVIGELFPPSICFIKFSFYILIIYDYFVTRYMLNPLYHGFIEL